MKKIVLGLILVSILVVFTACTSKTENFNNQTDVNVETSKTENATLEDISEWINIDLPTDFSIKNSSVVEILYKNEKIAEIDISSIKAINNSTEADSFVGLFGGMHARAERVDAIVDKGNCKYVPVLVAYELSPAEEENGATEKKPEMHYYFYSDNSKYIYDVSIVSKKISDDVIDKVLNGISMPN